MTETKDVWVSLVQQLVDRHAYMTNMWEYYMAEQALPLDTNELNSKFGINFADFRDNLARPIIDAAETRVRIQDITPNENAWKIWRRNEMTSESKLVHTDALVQGQAFVIVFPDDEEDGNVAGIWPQQSRNCAIEYSAINPRKKIAAMKYWSEKLPSEGRMERDTSESDGDWKVRVNIYFDDRIERFVSTKSGRTLTKNFDNYELYESDGGSGIQPHNLGEVPMFEFRANWDMNSQAARSDLEDAAPLIDAINKTFLDMMVASEYTAAPQRWATGVEIPLDPNTGKPIQSYASGADQLWTAANEQAKFGQFAPGALESYRSAIDALVDHLVYVSRTPKYALAGGSKYSSGENLRVIENPLRSRVSDHQQSFEPTWQKVIALALKIEGDTENFYDIDLLWLPANAPFATTERLEEMKLKVEVLGIPQEQAWKEMGYKQSEIETMKAQREEEILLEVGAADAAAQSALSSLDNPAVETTTGGLAAEF